MGLKRIVPWTTGEVLRLKKYASQGMSAIAIHNCNLLSRHTLLGIKKKMVVLGLGQAKYRLRGIRANYNSKRKRVKIEKFLRGEGCEMPSVKAAECLHISKNMVNYYRRKLGLVAPPLPLVEFKEKLAESQLRFWLNRRDWMYRELYRDSYRGDLENLFPCILCGEKWPRNSKYFYVYGDVLRPQCRACGRNLWKKAHHKKVA